MLANLTLLAWALSWLLAIMRPMQAYAQTYSATYLPSNTPDHSEDKQSGTNQCGSKANQTSMCQNAYLNAVDDWCIFGPPEPGAGSTIGSTERIEVSWCTKDGHGTRLIPPTSITAVHFIQTPDFVQITGLGNLTSINVPEGDTGGELDPHGADGKTGNPVGGLVFSSAFGGVMQMHEWTNFVSDSMFCFRACKDGPMAAAFCQHVYDTMGCEWNMPGNYEPNVFDSCKADSGEPMGIYGTSTFSQGQPSTPSAHTAPLSSECTTTSSIANGVVFMSSSASNTGTTLTMQPVGSDTTTGTAGGPRKTGNSALRRGVSRYEVYYGGGVMMVMLGVVVGGFM